MVVCDCGLADLLENASLACEVPMLKKCWRMGPDDHHLPTCGWMWCSASAFVLVGRLVVWWTWVRLGWFCHTLSAPESLGPEGELFPVSGTEASACVVFDKGVMLRSSALSSFFLYSSFVQVSSRLATSTRGLLSNPSG